jgi:predicted DNA repair protein MutK
LYSLVSAGDEARDLNRWFGYTSRRIRPRLEESVAGSSLLTLIDDIASLLDDIATMSKVAAKKTAGVLGDDLALNAQQVLGANADREFPIVWAVAKGSLVNKAILVPAALAISALLPWAITPLLMLGGAFLCYEGVEKVWHAWQDRAAKHGHGGAAAEGSVGTAEGHAPTATPAAAIDPHAWERERIKGAVRTDFILSAEIIVITLGTVAEETITRQLGVLVAISLIMTVGVYGLVAGIVKLDDAGLHLAKRDGAAKILGRGMVAAAPKLMRALSILGTIAMFLVGGGIFVHGIAPLHHFVEHAAEVVGHASVGFIGGLVGAALNGLIGVAVGAVVVAVVGAVKKALGKGHGAEGAAH